MRGPLRPPRAPPLPRPQPLPLCTQTPAGACPGPHPASHHGSAVVGSSYRLESLLASCVPEETECFMGWDTGKGSPKRDPPAIPPPAKNSALQSDGAERHRVGAQWRGVTDRRADPGGRQRPKAQDLPARWLGTRSTPSAAYVSFYTRVSRCRILTLSLWDASYRPCCTNGAESNQSVRVCRTRMPP